VRTPKHSNSKKQEGEADCTFFNLVAGGREEKKSWGVGGKRSEGGVSVVPAETCTGAGGKKTKKKKELSQIQGFRPHCMLYRKRKNK